MQTIDLACLGSGLRQLALGNRKFAKFVKFSRKAVPQRALRSQPVEKFLSLIYISFREIRRRKQTTKTPLNLVFSKQFDPPKCNGLRRSQDSLLGNDDLERKPLSNLF